MRVLLSSSSGSAVITTLGFSRWLLPCCAETTAAHNASSATPTIQPRATLGRLFVFTSPSVHLLNLGSASSVPVISTLLAALIRSNPRNRSRFWTTVGARQHCRDRPQSSL